MATRQGNAVLQHLRRAILLDGGVGLTDGQLLGCFIDQRDDAAFAALVRRHGPMVLSVCRRMVGNLHDADDAFQATFLVLIRKASSIKPRELVGNWLYGVAYHTALKARALASRRQAREKQVTAMPEPETVVPENANLDLQLLLDQELSRMPDKYRVPIVLCDLEGKSRKEAARQLGWLDGTLSGRLAQARQMLAKRLTARGFAVSAGVVAVVLSQTAAPAAVPASLLMSTVKAANVCAAGSAAGVVSAHAATLAEGVLKTMLFAKLKAVGIVFLLVAVVGIGLGFSFHLTSIAAQDQSQPPVVKEQEKEKNESKPPPEPAWKAEFRRAYGLKDGEVLKRVAAPFPNCRKEYCRSQKNLFFGSDVDDVILNYRWDGKNVEFSTWSINADKSKPKGWVLPAVLYALNIPGQEIEMDKELQQMHIEGEFVMRTGTARGESHPAAGTDLTRGTQTPPPLHADPSGTGSDRRRWQVRIETACEPEGE